jgi:hypothetical protein
VVHREGVGWSQLVRLGDHAVLQVDGSTSSRVVRRWARGTRQVSASAGVADVRSQWLVGLQHDDRGPWAGSRLSRLDRTTPDLDRS